MKVAIASMSLQFALFQNFIFPIIGMKDFKNVTKSLFPQKYLIMVLVTNVNIVNIKSVLPSDSNMWKYFYLQAVIVFLSYTVYLLLIL